MRNENSGLPIGFENNLVQQKFPADRPIFWGPKQKTKYPDEYNEPSEWIQFDLMKIPPVIRFVTGGNFVPVPSINRRIYLGHTPLENAFVLYISDFIFGGTRGDTAVGSGLLWRQLVQAVEIADVYSANMMTADVLNQVAYATEIMKPPTDVTVTQNYLGGPVNGTYAYSLGTHPGKEFVVNSGSPASYAGTNPGSFGPFEYESMDTEGLVIGDGGWQGDTLGHVLNANKLWLSGSVTDWIYWFLFNTISGSLPTQTNVLVGISFSAGESPTSGSWSTIIGLASLALTNPISPQRKDITGLILHP